MVKRSGSLSLGCPKGIDDRPYRNTLNIIVFFYLGLFTRIRFMRPLFSESGGGNRNTRNSAAMSALLVALGGVLVSCGAGGGGGGGGSNLVLISIAVTPSTPSIPNGLQEQFKANGTYSDGTSADLTSFASWGSNSASVATIEPGGLATATGIGTARITATLGKVSGATTLSVTANSLQNIVVTPAHPAIPLGLPQAFRATGNYLDGTSHDVTALVSWSSGTPSVATISPGGTAATVGVGSSIITATLGTAAGEATLTVTAALLQSITVIPASPKMPSGVNQQFRAIGNYSDGTSLDLTGSVTWNSGTGTVATVDPSGLAAAVGPGTSMMTAALGPISGTTLLTVTAALLQSITVSPANPTIPIGLSQPLSATGNYSDGTSHDLTSLVIWSSGTLAVATISPGGLAMGVATGPSLIRASSGMISGSTTLTVTPVALKTISVTPTKPAIPDGLTQPLSAAGNYSDGTSRDLTSAVTWSSGTPAVATISPGGLAISVSVGTSVMTAALGTISGNTTLTVTAAVLQSISVTPTKPAIPDGLTQPLSAAGNYSDGTSRDLTSAVTWSSGTPAVATISPGGLAISVSVGTSVMTAALGTISGNTTLTVTAAVLQSISVTPVNPTLPIGLTQPLSATGNYSDGTSRDLTPFVDWSSQTLGVATVASGGLVLAVGSGTSL